MNDGYPQSDRHIILAGKLADETCENVPGPKRAELSHDILNAFKPAESVADGRRRRKQRRTARSSALFGAAKGYLDEPWEYGQRQLLQRLS
jgi:hypothetical protein